MKEYKYSPVRKIGVSHIPALEKEAQEIDRIMRGLPLNSPSRLRLQKRRRVVCATLKNLRKKLL